MTRNTFYTSVLALSIGVGCRPRLPRDDPPRLLEERDGSLFVTSLRREVAPLVRQGSLFAVQRPISTTEDLELVAVLDVIEPAPPGSGTVPVALRCRSLRDGKRKLAGLTVTPLRPTERPSIGQCMAKVVEVSGEDHPRPYVRLDVGSYQGLLPGDVYHILGRPVVADGYVPLGLDTTLDIRCTITREELLTQTARCSLLQPSGIAGSLHNRYVVFENRPE